MIEIRKCEIKDVEQLREANKTDSFTQYGFEEFINQPECKERCFAAFDDEKAVAFMLTDIVENKERIYTALVNPKYRQQRIMTHLFREILNDMAKCNKNEIFLNVRDHKKGNISAYLMGGFKEIKRTPNYYGNGDTAVRMEFNLKTYKNYLEKKKQR